MANQEVDKDVVKEIVINSPLQSSMPVVSFAGSWTTKEVQLILRAIPKAFRQYQYDRRKSGIDKFQENANA